MKKSLLFSLIFFYLSFGYSNNIQVSNVSLVNLNTSTHTVDIQFDLSWENSWRGYNCDFTEGWDAAWVFVKYREACFWQTPHLDKNNHTTVSGVTIAANDNVGAMIYRSTAGTGNFTATGLRLRWDYGADGISDAKMSYSLTNTDSVEVAVMAIEMVYIPEAEFEVGGGKTGYYVYSWYDPATAGAYKVTGTGSTVTLDNTSGNLWADGNRSISNPETLSDDYPTGFKAFYCMKYEVSQGQYVDFLNMIPYGMALNRKPNNPGNYGQNIGNPKATAPHWYTTTPERPVNTVNWDDAAAYADWSGQRIMTELEYEKVCRGTSKAMPQEFAFGSQHAHTSAYTVVNANTADEQVSDADTVYGNLVSRQTHQDSALRCGVFAASLPNAGTCGISRSYTGATFYGVMEMSGNLWEPIVNLGYEAGRAYRGGNGDGILAGDGTGNQSGWVGHAGGGYKGGSFYENTGDVYRYSFTVASRNRAGDPGTSKEINNGIRCVRDMSGAVIKN